MNVLMTAVIDPDPSTAELDRLGDEIAELSAHLEAATARLLDLIREFDARAGWNHGFRSCAHWLSWRVGLDIGAAREKVRVARALGTLPRLAKALAHGELSYAKVRALTRVATPATEERLLAVGRAGTAEHVERIVRGWRRVDQKAEARESAARHRSRALQVYRNEDGMVTVRGRLAPEVGELLIQALTAAREALYQRRQRTFDDAGSADVSAETPAFEQQQADALALLAETALHHGIDPGAPGERYQVVVHVDAPVLADPAGARPVRARRTASTFPRKRRGAWPATLAGGDATCAGRASRGSRGADADDPARSTPRAAPSRPRVSLSGLWCALRSGPSHQTLGAGRTDDALEPHHAVPAPPSCRSRGRLPGGSRA